MSRTDVLRGVLIGLAGLIWATERAPGGQPNPLGLIPTPQHCRPVETVFEISEKTPILLSSRASSREMLTARLLQHRIRKITGLMLPIVRGASGQGIRLVLAGTPEGMAALSRCGRQMPFRATTSARGWNADYQYEQAYFLNVDAGGVLVAANTPLGMLYGTMTLAQLVTPDELILGCEVMDWPEMRFRGTHLRLGGPPGEETVRPTCAQIKVVLETMARFKLNYLLLEPGEGAELPSLPGLWRLEALTVTQQREIRQFATAFGVRIVPVVDSWSSLPHWQSHPATRDLVREGRADLSQSAVADLLARAAIDLNRNLNTSDFIHLGGRGACRDADAYDAFHKRLMARVRRATGKRPMLWGMSRTTPAATLAAWPEDVVLVPDHPTNPRGSWHRDGVQVTDVWASGLDAGRAQIALATPVASRSTDPQPFSQWGRCERHLALWARSVYDHGRDDGGLGMMATLGSWVGGDAVEAALPELCWLAELSWNDNRAGDLPDARFDRAVGWHLCGVATEGEQVLQACRRLGELAPDPTALSVLRQTRFRHDERPIGEALRQAAARRVPPTGGADERTTAPLPQAASNGERTGQVGRQIAFDASRSRDAAGGRAVRASWDFGDGARCDRMHTHHVYAEAGTYLASLTISDAAGSSRREPILVNIAPASAAVADGRTDRTLH